MSILVEIAEQADVSVEGVLRVLTREAVSEAVLERVLGVLDELTPEQNRSVQRFALAALHDVLPRPGEATAGVGEALVPGEPAAARPAGGSDVALVQLSAVLGELAEAVRDLRRETDTERRESVDDLAVLIDLITTGWQGLDTRLGRIERQVGRLDSGRKGVAPPPPVRVSPAPVAPAPVAAAVAESSELPVAGAGRRRRLPFAAALALAGAVIGTLAVLQLVSGSASNLADVVSARETSRPAPPPVIASVLRTTVAETQPPAKPASPGSPAKPASPGFKPTRNWAWAPVSNADYYNVELRRGGEWIYRASPSEPRLTLPKSVDFRPGTYRWIVRPGFGERAENRVGKPVVDSGFTVS
ncbi:MAG: hypothetical protein ABIR67_12500 [Gaiellaceae bacterium]